MNQSSDEVLSLDNVLINRNYLKEYKIACTLKTTVYEYVLFMSVISNETVTQKFYSELPHALNFSCTWDKEDFPSR